MSSRALQQFRRMPLAAACTIVAGSACGGPGLETPTAPLDAELSTLASHRGGGRMVTVPMRGWWNGSEGAPVPASEGCLARIPTTQEGRATRLGPFTGEGETCPTSQTPTTEPPFWHHDPAPPYMVIEFDSKMVWTAANGDELRVEAESGVFVMSANGAASVRGVLMVTGGTGRFEGASGRLRVRGGRGAGEAGDQLRFRGRIKLRR